jgi:hypothetical protein
MTFSKKQLYSEKASFPGNTPVSLRNCFLRTGSPGERTIITSSFSMLRFQLLSENSESLTTAFIATLEFVICDSELNHPNVASERVLFWSKPRKE